MGTHKSVDGAETLGVGGLNLPKKQDKHRANLHSQRVLLRMASVARVDRRLLRYYLIVRRLPNVFALAYRSLGSIYYDTGSPQDGKTPFGWLHPCRLFTDSRRYLIVGASATMPLYSSFIFSLNDRACQQLARCCCWVVKRRSDRVGWSGCSHPSW